MEVSIIQIIITLLFIASVGAIIGVSLFALYISKQNEEREKITFHHKLSNSDRQRLLREVTSFVENHEEPVYNEVLEGIQQIIKNSGK